MSALFDMQAFYRFLEEAPDRELAKSRNYFAGLLIAHGILKWSLTRAIC